MNDDHCAEAVFGTTVQAEVFGDGTLRLDPPCRFYPYGTAIRLTAFPGAGHGFALWGGSAVSTNNPLTLLVTNPLLAVTAVFAPLSQDLFALTVVSEGSGTVLITPTGSRFKSGSVVVLTALPDSGQDF